MKESTVRAILIEELGNIAPDADVASLSGDEDLRDAIDIDSIDFLNFVTALHQRLGIDVPEVDYPKLSTLNRAVSYVGSRA